MTVASDSTLGVKKTAQVKYIQEMAIAISAKNLTPTMLSEEFLKFSGIVPNEWETTNQPVLNPNFAQLSFQNGVKIVAQPGTVTLVETIGNKEIEALAIPEVALKYVQKLPNAEYQNLNISPKILVPLAGGQDAANKYITKMLLAPGPWQNIGESGVQAGINLLYELQRCQLSLSINEARLQSPEQAPISALLFSGTFNYSALSQSPQERLSQLEKQLNSWKTDWQAFKEIVEQRFLRQKQEEELPASVF